LKQPRSGGHAERGTGFPGDEAGAPLKPAEEAALIRTKLAFPRRRSRGSIEAALATDAFFFPGGVSPATKPGLH